MVSVQTNNNCNYGTSAWIHYILIQMRIQIKEDGSAKSTNGDDAGLP